MNAPIGLAPTLFVVLWSTGFISAKFGLPYAGPLTYLLARLALVSALMAVVALAAGANWPGRAVTWLHLTVAGLLVHGLYLGGVFVAISRGMPAGTASMLVGMQPILTVFLARSWFGERTAARQWWGLALGLVGVYFVVEHKIRLTGLDWVSSASVLVALIAISIGTLYQKRFCGGVDLRAGSAIQFGACAIVYGLLAPWFESLRIDWTWQFQFALAWSVLVLSVGAISLLYWLLRRGAAADVARLFYLVPAVTAVMAHLLFDEPITVLAVAGMALIAAGVMLAKPPLPARPRAADQTGINPE
ncbi:MAG: DMT family transporter [Betaproteobacteria bacterium]|nr:DMT family transporter [Betaproteobacteria bacterium]